MELKFISNVNKERVDIFICQNSENISRSFVKKISEDGGLTVNGKLVKASERIKEGDEIVIDLPEPKLIEAVPQKIPLEVLYEDEDIIVVNKEKGMVVHPACGNYDGTLVNALLGLYGDKLSNINGVIRPGIVHRIDKDTTGVLVVARNNVSHERLSVLFKSHDIKREYIALVDGCLESSSGTIDAPIGRHIVDRKKMSVNTKNGRHAITHFVVLQRYKKATLIKAVLETGRTHQIRVHMAYIGHPLVGDHVYGKKKNSFNIEGQLLHAKTLGFIHPTKNEFMEFTTELPDFFKDILNRL
jgi:23S rRNA pseudouridine1911/1915/1917 synthase